MKNTKFVAGLTLTLILLSCAIVLIVPHFLSVDYFWESPSGCTGQNCECGHHTGKLLQNEFPCGERDMKFYIPDDFKVTLSTEHGPELKAPENVGKILLCIFSLGLFSLCFSFICHDIRRRRYIGAMGAIAIITLLQMGVLHILIKNYPVDFSFLVIMLLALPSLMITPLFGFKPAVCVGITVSFLAAILLGEPLKVLVIGTVLCCAGGFFTQHCCIASYRKYIFYNFASITVAAILLCSCFAIIMAQDWSIACGTIVKISLIAVLGSAISVAIAVVLLPLIEWLFRIETNMTYMDLANENHYLLKRLMTEASGTWKHCQEVADVASDAAKQINANSLKVRACALYHDVGKLSAPEKFTENSPDSAGQTAVKDLDPLQAAQTIRSHVDEGKKLIHYPYKSIKEAIASHHGNTRISFFYEEAVKRAGNDVDVNEADFRYRGPLPANREEVILMLADSTCAAVNSMREKTPEKIESKVSEIFFKHLEQRQYDQSGITVQDMLTVYSSILNSLLTKNKYRIDYKKAENVKK